ncbi:MAG: decaprenyl-phosphate phosphoribosyltransferase [Candidatus Omnitrophota bacterium]|nr:decaprenyl-phosphate phosphoribosyltransferase [Candidatus Omnitrophota bacterium]
MGRIFKSLFLILRPKHWIKNLFIFAGPFFSLNFFVYDNIKKLSLGFICWCGISSATYIFNDIIDRKEDAFHTLKKRRPISSGLISTNLAWIVFILLSLFFFLIAFCIKTSFGYLILAYFLINLLYSLYLKHVFILDVMCISFGFILRVISGAMLINVGFSEWLIMCTLLLSLLLGFGKRQEEITSLEKVAMHHRRVLKDYDVGFLQHIPYVLVSSTIVCYMLYTVSQEAVRKFGTKNLIYTTVFVIYGLFRYVYVVNEKKKGADPTQIIFQDLPSVINILLWIMVSGFIIYLL